MIKLIAFFEKGGREAIYHHLLQQLHAKVVHGSKEFVKARSSRLNVFYKKGIIESFAI